MTKEFGEVSLPQGERGFLDCNRDGQENQAFLDRGFREGTIRRVGNGIGNFLPPEASKPATRFFSAFRLLRRYIDCPLQSILLSHPDHAEKNRARFEQADPFFILEGRASRAPEPKDGGNAPATFRGGSDMPRAVREA